MICSCEADDLGFEMPDTRATYWSGDKKIVIVIRRIWDRSCECGERTWRPEWLVKEDGRIVATVPSEAAAEAVVEAEYEVESDYDADWESEKWLRQAEGWG